MRCDEDGPACCSDRLRIIDAGTTALFSMRIVAKAVADRCWYGARLRMRMRMNFRLN